MRKIVIIILVLVIVALASWGIYAYFKARSNTVIDSFTAQGYKIGSASNPKEVTYITEPLKYNFGISIYPNAKAYEDQTARSSVANSNGIKTAIGVFSTNDSVDRVVSYYQRQIGSGVQTNTSVIQNITMKVVAKKNVLDPIVEVYKQDKTTMILIQKKV